MTTTATSAGDGSGLAKRPTQPFGLALILFLAAAWVLALTEHWPPLWLRDLLLAAPLGLMLPTIIFPSKSWAGSRLSRVAFVFVFGSGLAGLPAGLQALYFAHFRNVWWAVAIAAAYGVAACLCARALRARLPRVNSPSRPIHLAPDPPWTRWAFPLAGMVCLAGYAFALFTALDEQFDHAAPQVIRRQVLDKHHTASRAGIDNDATLESWGWTSSNPTMEVGPAVFDRLSKGGEACIRLHRGYLGAEWFEVTACRQ